MNHRESDFEGMEIRHTFDVGTAADDPARYLLQWESLGANRDKRPPEPHPQPSLLRVHKLISELPAGHR